MINHKSIRYLEKIILIISKLLNLIVNKDSLESWFIII